MSLEVDPTGAGEDASPARRAGLLWSVRCDEFLDSPDPALRYTGRFERSAGADTWLLDRYRARFDDPDCRGLFWAWADLGRFDRRRLIHLGTNASPVNSIHPRSVVALRPREDIGFPVDYGCWIRFMFGAYQPGGVEALVERWGGAQSVLAQLEGDAWGERLGDTAWVFSELREDDIVERWKLTRELVEAEGFECREEDDWWAQSGMAAVSPYRVGGRWRVSVDTLDGDFEDEYDGEYDGEYEVQDDEARRES